MEEITRLLVSWSNGDKTALDRLMPLVYDELRRLARSHLRRERPDHSLQPTALVHEAYVRLIDQENVSWQGRAQFFGLAARMMRNILVDHARARRTAKRAGGEYKLSLSKIERYGRKPEVELTALDDALSDLSRLKPEHARVVELKYFGGLTIPEIAEVVGVSHATIERQWAFARSWLRREMEGKG